MDNQKVTSIARVLELNKDRIIEARKILDSAAALSLLGASVDQRARDMIVTGGVAALSGTAVLTGVALTGIAGPVILGMALVPTAAKVGIAAGLSFMTGGFIRGFRKGIEQTEQTSIMMATVKRILEEHGQKIKEADVSALFNNNKQEELTSE